MLPFSQRLQLAGHGTAEGLVACLALLPKWWFYFLFSFFFQSILAAISVCHQRRRGLFPPASSSSLIGRPPGARRLWMEVGKGRVCRDHGVMCGFLKFLRRPFAHFLTLTRSHLTRTHTHKYHCSSSSSCEHTCFTMTTWDCTYASKLKGITDQLVSALFQRMSNILQCRTAAASSLPTICVCVSFRFFPPFISHF